MTEDQVTVRLADVEVRRVVDGKCPVCQRFTRRSRIFSQPMNPARSWAAVRADVEAEAFKWEPDFRHKACK